MKRLCLLLSLCLLLCPLAALCEDAPRIVLITAYFQRGWGDNVQIGCVDSQGELWFFEGSAHDTGCPSDINALLDWLPGAENLTKTGEIDLDLFSLNSLLATVPDQGGEAAPAANDAGTEYAYAVRYAGGERELVLLGMSGDDRFENTSPDAQALYLLLRSWFPRVTSYFGSELMGPASFQPRSLLDFCGYANVDLSVAAISAVSIDCETGPLSVELTDDEQAAIRARISASVVTGKASSVVTTGGSTVYTFMDAQGNSLASFEFYGGLFVRPDGMYRIE